MSSTHDDLIAALRQRAESDRILGATAWPVARALLIARRAAAAAAASAPARSPASAPRPAPVPTPPPAPVRPRTSPAIAAPPPVSIATHISAVAGAAQAAAAAADTPEATERREALAVLDQGRVKGCTRCGLSATRTHTVFGQGSPTARIVFVGEAPGFDEDRTGLAFVGRAGRLLTDMIQLGMGLGRDEVFICNVLKCRPPDNRTPAPGEIAACTPHLYEQLAILRPQVIVALGAPAAQTLLATREAIGRLRGRFHDFNLPDAALRGDAPIPLMPTYHPAYLLRNPPDKVKAWDDLKKVLEFLGLPIPKVSATDAR